MQQYHPELSQEHADALRLVNDAPDMTYDRGYSLKVKYNRTEDPGAMGFHTHSLFIPRLYSIFGQGNVAMDGSGQARLASGEWADFHDIGLKVANRSDIAADIKTWLEHDIEGPTDFRQFVLQEGRGDDRVTDDDWISAPLAVSGGGEPEKIKKLRGKYGT